METVDLSDQDELRCEEKCSYERVNCEEDLEGASICKTRERNCFDECP